MNMKCDYHRNSIGLARLNESEAGTIQLKDLQYMKRNSSISASSAAIFLLFALLVCASTGCGTAILTPGYSGGKIKAGYQIPINPEGEQTAVYQTDDVSINYQYLRDGDGLKIAGTVNFGSGTQANFNYVDYFNLSLLLADSQGSIIAAKSLVSSNSVNLRSVNSRVLFNRDLNIPAEATFMAFAYTGQAGLGGGGSSGGGNSQFWEYPIAK